MGDVPWNMLATAQRLLVTAPSFAAAAALTAERECLHSLYRVFPFHITLLLLNWLAHLCSRSSKNGWHAVKCKLLQIWCSLAISIKKIYARKVGLAGKHTACNIPCRIVGQANTRNPCLIMRNSKLFSIVQVIMFAFIVEQQNKSNFSANFVSAACLSVGERK